MPKHEVWTSVKIVAWTKEYLSAKGIENARLEAEWMLSAATGLNRVGLYLNYDKPLSDSELAVYRDMVSRRARREPLQHILGTQEFCGLEFEVSPDVLIPRHDTELLVTQTLLRSPPQASILDMGTGSGCIAITLAKRLPAAFVSASDISSDALSVARRNAIRNEVNVEFIQGALLSCVPDRKFSLIVSNPPYIPTADIDQLEPEVRDYDPWTALDGGADGLGIYRQLIPAAVDHLLPGGWLLVEIGIGQAHDVAECFTSIGRYQEPFVSLDEQGIERVVGAQIKERL
ncbi:MAG TPA: peptide chain release factor N(5)-glutamine methyltransferase [Desulfuromonadales bacterium]|nr:peptide chain release factor N(5)-glutamine methyltransferase [Desulfuromonadales bacterium]